MSDTKISYSIGGLDLLAVAFIVLKLTHIIAWSWWWVLAPVWIPAAIVVVLLIALGIFVMVSK